MTSFAADRNGWRNLSEESHVFCHRQTLFGARLTIWYLQQKDFWCVKKQVHRHFKAREVIKCSHYRKIQSTKAFLLYVSVSLGFLAHGLDILGRCSWGNNQGHGRETPTGENTRTGSDTGDRKLQNKTGNEPTPWPRWCRRQTGWCGGQAGGRPNVILSLTILQFIFYRKKKREKEKHADKYNFIQQPGEFLLCAFLYSTTRSSNGGEIIQISFSKKHQCKQMTIHWPICEPVFHFQKLIMCF